MGASIVWWHNKCTHEQVSCVFVSVTVSVQSDAFTTSSNKQSLFTGWRSSNTISFFLLDIIDTK